jgi:hypothetical protein
MYIRVTLIFFILSTNLCRTAQAKRPVKSGLAQTAKMNVPDLQSVLGGAYQVPLELSDRATPGAVI